jgi:hypothetical protein
MCEAFPEETTTTTATWGWKILALATEEEPCGKYSSHKGDSGKDDPDDGANLCAWRGRPANCSARTRGWWR